jgi:hypothetical protein
MPIDAMNENVVFVTRKNQNTPHQREYERADDRERQQRRLEERRHDEDDEHDAEQHVLHHDRLCLVRLLEATAELPGVAGRQIERFHQRLDVRSHLVHRRAV